MMQENLLKEYGLYINGEWRPASDGATFSSTDPAANIWRYVLKQLRWM